MTGESDKQPKRAIELYSGVWHALLFQTQATFTFRRVAEIGMPAASAQLRVENEGFAREMADGSAFDRFMRDKAGILEIAGGKEGISKTLTDAQVRSARAAVDAASLVFMHTTLDVAVSDLCEVVALISPEAWDDWIGRRQVNLERVRQSPYAEIRQQAIADALVALRKESLMKRIDCLFSFCRPPADHELLRGFQFDSVRLRALDHARQEAVHGRGPETVASITVDDLEFLQRTGLHLLALLNWKFDIRVDARLAMGAAVGAVRQMDEVIAASRKGSV